MKIKGYAKIPVKVKNQLIFFCKNAVTDLLAELNIIEGSNNY